jgi:hypothetical protein
MLAKIISLILGLLTGGATQQGGTGATAAAGAFNSVAFYGAAAGFVAWLVGPGRDFTITLRGWEIWAVVLAAAFAGAMFLHIQPPKPPGQP